MLYLMGRQSCLGKGDAGLNPGTSSVRMLPGFIEKFCIM